MRARGQKIVIGGTAYLCLNHRLEFTMSAFTSRLLHIVLCFYCILTFTYAQAQTSYREEIEKWHRERVQSLKAEDGWLNLVGLHWLTPGNNTFGSGDRVAIKFPDGTIPSYAGWFNLNNESVIMVLDSGVNATVDGKKVREAYVFHRDSARAPEVRCGDLKWTIIKRDDKYGIRLRNLKSTSVTNFKGIERYEVKESWKVPAVLTPAVVPGGISITNVLGQTTKQVSPGKLEFSIGGKKYTLDALDGGKDELFIIFGDETNGVETYPSGRYLYVKKPGEDGVVMLDFNKAYNPPCAFTPYATCPLPPRQNVLPVFITAGEKNFGEHK